MSSTSKRLVFLQGLVTSGTADAFAFYGLAMEHRSLGNDEEALGAFRTLREKHPDYVASYLMCGQLLATLGRPADAAEWLTTGIDVARKAGNSHAAGELQSALDALEG
jgi:hypothetical protein